MFKPQIQRIEVVVTLAIFSIVMVYFTLSNITYVEKLGLKEKIKSTEIMEKALSTLKKEVATKVEQEAAAEAEKRARSITAESAIISATKVLRKELEKQKKQIETLQAEIIDLRIKLREATTYYYK